MSATASTQTAPLTPDTLWIRKGTLVVRASNGKVLDLSELQFRFEVKTMDTETPNTAFIRIYNLAPVTAKQIQAVTPVGLPSAPVYTRVTLQAGYVNGNYGIIFDGAIVQTRRGKENNVDSYLDILAADGDTVLVNAIVNTTLAPGATPSSQYAAVQSAITGYDGSVQPSKNSAALTGGVLPRGKVLFGMARDHLRNIGHSTGSRISIQNGVMTIVPVTSYLPGEIIAINSATGMIGIPEATEQGIMVTTLLNPNIIIGQRVQINNKDVNSTIVQHQGLYPNYGSQAFFADVTTDGIYRVMVAEHEGDMRGNPWYSKLTCLSINPAAGLDVSVAPNS